ncbi:MAG: phosphatase PAP2 family protein [Oscillospiraceae bacterium]
MQFDLNFLIWIQQNLRSALLDGAMVFVSTIGNAGMVWLVASAALICTRRYRKYGLVLVGALVLGYLVGDVLIKNLVCRPRPFTEVSGLELLILPPNSFSFPSGHTLSSFAAATVLFAANRRFGTAAYLLAALIAFSRMYLFVHYLTDILAGMLCGIAVACMALWAARMVEHHILYRRGS